ncbi:hypothetical protein K443DRAFT_434819 [Laccaria amethystina LaAM-08-1]|uniref:Uncharacterized protein n=1 Tax=Laccaria amethystina LaAM-08-1 TaxID=1095629 RepID=A0A0C9XRB0_9AGAR|nr:hypothetical protein K443DRAFT_434819 [Laccaria amethystina LaAM-08-1]
MFIAEKMLTYHSEFRIQSGVFVSQHDWLKVNSQPFLARPESCSIFSRKCPCSNPALESLAITRCYRFKLLSSHVELKVPIKWQPQRQRTPAGLTPPLSTVINHNPFPS